MRHLPHALFLRDNEREDTTSSQFRVARSAHPFARMTTDDVPIKLVLADVDGTLVTPQKDLTERCIRAVQVLGEARIAFAITSGRPPRGLLRYVEPLKLRTPIAGFNGGMIVKPDLTPIEVKTLPADVIPKIVRGAI